MPAATASEGERGAGGRVGEGEAEGVEGLAVISCGRHNPFGHPRAETVRRLEGHGVSLFRTDRDGAVVVSGERGRLRVRGTVPAGAE